MECFSKNCLTSEGVAAGAGDEPAEVDAPQVTEGDRLAPLVEVVRASFRFFFFSFFDSKICSAFVSPLSSRASRFRFFFFSPSIDQCHVLMEGFLP